MRLGLLVLVLLQQPTATARLDRDRVAVGEEVELTVAIESVGDEPPSIASLSLVGLEVTSQRDRRSVRFVGDTPHRTLTLVFRLRATMVGVGRIGPVEVVHRGSRVAVDAITVDIVRAGPPTAVPDNVRTLLLTLTPEGADSNRVALTLVVAPDSVMLGQQADLVLAAWFPRDIRLRVRGQPTIQPPQVRGAWVYERPTPPGVALTRAIGGREYDVFVVHLAAFPLTSGGMDIGPAKVSYSLPLTFSFLSREVRLEVASAPTRVPVASLPSGGPQGFAGAIAAGMTLDLAVSDRDLPIGSAARVELRLTGVGNVALWPEPDVPWPSTVRAYPQDVVVEVLPAGSLIRGSKTFNYLIVPDTAGVHRVAAVQYDYFDPGSGAYGVLRTAPLEFVTRSTGGAVQQGREPLLQHRRGPLAGTTVSRWVVYGVWLAVALGGLAARAFPRRIRRAPPARVARTRSHQSTLLNTVRGVLQRRVPEEAHLGAPELAAALRAAGVDPSLAHHAARVRDRLQQSLFGPADELDADELRLEAEEVLRALALAPQAVATGARASAVLVLLGLTLPSSLLAQSAEALYDAGAVREAADSFAHRVRLQPEAAAHWYNLSLSYQALGDRGRATGALLMAARRAPRNVAIRRRVDRQAAFGRAALTWIAPITPRELLAVGTGLWVLAWGAVMLRRRARWSILVMAVAVGCLAGALALGRRYDAPVAFVTADGAVLHEAPFGPSAGLLPLGAGDAMRVERREGAWLKVRRGDRVGWIRRADVAVF
ncbi:MAG TPA: BatD family protein [Gemmatimonadales bacterium]